MLVELEKIKTEMKQFFEQMKLRFDRVFDKVIYEVFGTKTVEPIELQSSETNQNLIDGCRELESIENSKQLLVVHEPNNQTRIVDSMKVNS